MDVARWFSRLSSATLLPASVLAVAASANADALSLLEAQTAPPADPAVPSITTTPSQQLEKFGAQNSLRLNFEGAFITNFDKANMVQGRIGLAWFFFENVELDMYVTLDGVSQLGDNAFGGGFDMQLRWHFLAFDDWSLFIELGGGLLGTSAPVPMDGSEFNFTPNAGFGVTYAMNETTRLYAGAGWFHISNAGLYMNNPGRDSLTIWMGLSFSM